MPTPIDFWFDFVSGYSWIAMHEAETFAATHDVRWNLRPFLLDVVVRELDRRTIAQVEATRSYAIFDVCRLAHRHGLTMGGPPKHPFVSLRALRTQLVFRESEQAIPLARALFDAAYQDNRSLEELDTIRDVVSSVGLPTDDLERQIRDPKTKQMLRRNTAEARERGVLGAPYFFLDGEPFWGQDRMPLLAERLGGAPGLPRATRDQILTQS